MLRRRNRVDWREAANEFATEVEGYMAWLNDRSIPFTLAEVQHRLLSVYWLGIELPDPPLDDLTEGLEAVEPAPVIVDWAGFIRERGRELPFTEYTRSVRPHDASSRDLEAGDLVEDLAQVGKHLLPGLAHFRAGAPAWALVQWRMELPRWGAHATNAIRAIQCTISKLSEESDPPAT